MENKILIRDFQTEDLPFLTELTLQLGYPSTLEQMTKRMEIILKLETYWTLVAVQGDKVIGYTGFNKNYFWEQDGFFIKIQALVVHQSYRRMGVGKMLMDSVEKFAKQINAKQIVLTSGNREERETAHKFYPQMGFDPSSTAYKKILTES